jgi:preprotein translocase subunit SecA
MIREDLPDRVYKTEDGKFKAVIEEIKIRCQKKQPVLVGTTSIEKNEYLGKLLEREGIKHQILNAKNHEREGEIIAQAGQPGTVTIATNMAGRGVDIILGGNPLNQEKRKEVIKAGGLHIIGTARHEARRIDNQLRGRAGRQGDPGSSQFFISLEDDLLRIFGSDKIKSLMGFLKIPEDQPIEAKMVSGAIESAQFKIEGFNFDTRKRLLDFDDVLNKHRTIIYKKREEVLEKAQSFKLKPLILEMIKKADYSEQNYEEKEKEIGSENMRQIEKTVYLRILDMLWMEHLDNMEHLRDTVQIRAYGQRDPLIEYKNEGHRIFQELLNRIESEIVQSIFKVRLVEKPLDIIQRPIVQNLKNNIGRNSPCPCGSGKKYKKCCGNK